MLSTYLHTTHINTLLCLMDFCRKKRIFWNLVLSWCFIVAVLSNKNSRKSHKSSKMKWVLMEIFRLLWYSWSFLLFQANFCSFSYHFCCVLSRNYNTSTFSRMYVTKLYHFLRKDGRQIVRRDDSRREKWNFGLEILLVSNGRYSLESFWQISHAFVFHGDNTGT